MSKRELKRIGDMVRFAQKGKNISDEVLAGRIGINVRTLQRWKRGDHQMLPVFVKAIARELEINEESLQVN